MVTTRTRKYSPEPSNIAPEEPSLLLARFPLELKLMIVDYLLPVNTYVEFRAHFAARFHDGPQGEKRDLSKLPPWNVVAEPVENVLKIAQALLPTRKSNEISRRADHNIAEMILNGIDAILQEDPNDGFCSETDESEELHAQIVDHFEFASEVGIQSKEICRALKLIPEAHPDLPWYRRPIVTFHLAEMLEKMEKDELDKIRHDWKWIWKGRYELKRAMYIMVKTISFGKRMLLEMAEIRFQTVCNNHKAAREGREEFYGLMDYMAEEFAPIDTKDLDWNLMLFSPDATYEPNGSQLRVCYIS